MRVDEFRHSRNINSLPDLREWVYAVSPDSRIEGTIGQYLAFGINGYARYYLEIDTLSCRIFRGNGYQNLREWESVSEGPIGDLLVGFFSVPIRL